MRKKSMMAADFAAELRNDPDFAARKHQFYEKRQGEIQYHGITAQPVLDELRQAGFDVASVDELRASGVAYRAAIPVLLKWLPLISDPDSQRVNRSDIVSTMGETKGSASSDS